MERKTAIDNMSPSRARRSLSAGWLAAAAGVLTFAGVAPSAFAVDPTPPNTFEAGTTISASEVNENFERLYEAVSALEEARASEPRISSYGTIYIDNDNDRCQASVSGVNADNISAVTYVPSRQACDITFDDFEFDVEFHLASITPQQQGTLEYASTGEGNLRIIYVNGSGPPTPDTGFVQFVIVTP
jgi:hypothetical protein